MKKVGLIGFGTIGKYIYDNLKKDGVEFVFIYKKTKIEEGNCAGLVVTSEKEVEEKCKQGVDLVIEAATSQAVTALAPVVLKYADMAVFSSTAFADENFLKSIQELCQKNGHRLYIPHGAVLGYDGIVDGQKVLQEVTITTTKSPKSLGRTDTTKTVVFEGATREACKLYPRNVNVHAGAALAGLGFDRTTSRIVSDPQAPGNMHTIEIKADGCQFKIEVLSVSTGGVTGAYTPVSAYSSVKRILFSQGITLI